MYMNLSAYIGEDLLANEAIDNTEKNEVSNASGNHATNDQRH